MSTGADMNVDIEGGGGGGPDLRELVDAIKDQSGKMATLTTSIGELVTKMDSLTKSSGKGQKAQKASQTADPATAAQDEGHNRMSEMDSLRKLRNATARHMRKVNDGRSVTIAALDKLQSYQTRASRILTRAVEGGEIGKFGTIAESLEFEMDRLNRSFQKKKKNIQNVINDQNRESNVSKLVKLREEQGLLYDQYTDGRIATTSTVDALEKFDRKIKKLVDTLNESGTGGKFKTNTKKTDHIKDIILQQKSDKEQLSSTKKIIAAAKKHGELIFANEAAAIKATDKIHDALLATAEKLGLQPENRSYFKKQNMGDMVKIVKNLKEQKENKKENKRLLDIDKKHADAQSRVEKYRERTAKERKEVEQTDWSAGSSGKNLINDRLFQAAVALGLGVKDLGIKIKGIAVTEDMFKSFSMQDKGKFIGLAKESNRRSGIDEEGASYQKKVDTYREGTARDRQESQKKKENAFTKEYDYWFDLSRKMQLLGGHFKLSSKSAMGLIMGLEKFEDKGKAMGKSGYTTSSSPFKGLSDELNTKLEEAKGRASKGSSGKKPKETFLQSAAKQVNPATLGISVLQTALSSMTGAITGIAGALLGSPIVAVITALLAPFQSLMSSVGKALTVMHSWFMIVTGLAGALKRLELQLDSYVAKEQLKNDIMLSLDTAVQRAATGISASTAKLGSGVVDAVENILSNPLTGLLDIVDKISKFVGLVNPGLMDRYNKVLENLMALIGSALQPVVSEITSLLYIFGTQLKPVIGMIGSQLAVAVRAFAMAILPVIPDLIRGLLALAQTLIGFVADVGIKLATEGPGTGALGKSPEQRIREEEQRLNEIDGITRDVNTPEQAPAGAAYNMTNRGLAESQIKKDIAKEQPAADFMDSAIAKNAKFSSGMDMGKSSVQKAFESSSAYGQDPSDQQTLDAAQAEFYKNPAAWVKKAMAGAENKPRQQVGGNVGGEAGGPNKVQAMMMLARMAGAVAGAPAAALRDVGIIT